MEINQVWLLSSNSCSRHKIVDYHPFYGPSQWDLPMDWWMVVQLSVITFSVAGIQSSLLLQMAIYELLVSLV